MEDHVPLPQDKNKKKQKKAEPEAEKLQFVTLFPGDIFGEISLVAAFARRASLQAVTACDIFMLERSSLQNVLQYHPKIKKTIDERAHKRFGSTIDAPEAKAQAGDYGFEKAETLKETKEEPKHTLLNPEGIDEALLQKKLAQSPQAATKQAASPTPRNTPRASVLEEDSLRLSPVQENTTQDGQSKNSPNTESEPRNSPLPETVTQECPSPYSELEQTSRQDNLSDNDPSPASMSERTASAEGSVESLLHESPPRGAMFVESSDENHIKSE